MLKSAPHYAPGSGLFARALRGSAFTAGSYAISQIIRLASNLVLTRLLFPEAFGLMALVSVALVGLAMFSDVGVGPAISQHPRGDEQVFLDTAYSINVARGGLLWLLTCALAYPMAVVYSAPDLMWLLPTAGITLLIAGFNPTRIDTANRHLLLGWVTLLDLIAQLIGIAAMVVLAFVLQSVWALVIGAIIGSAAKLVIVSVWLPGPANAFRWDRAAGRDLIHFGKWIFLSTACGFLLAQGDKAIFGAYLSLQELGVYNIGYFLASFPVLLAGAVVGRIMIPLYRNHPPAASVQNFQKMRRLRFAVTGGALILLTLLAMGGEALIGVMYDARYAGAGAIVVAVACMQMPGVVGMTYDQSALAAGDSRTYFLLMALKAVVQTGAFVIGIAMGGLMGALLAQAVAVTALHPAIVMLARKHNAWDPVHDAVFFVAAAGLAGFALWSHGWMFGGIGL